MTEEKRRQAVNEALELEVTDEQWQYLQEYWKAFTRYADSCVYADCIDTIRYEIQSILWEE